MGTTHAKPRTRRRLSIQAQPLLLPQETTSCTALTIPVHHYWESFLPPLAKFYRAFVLGGD